MIESMQLTFKVLGATPSLSWQKSLATDLLNMHMQQHLVWFCVVGVVLLALWVPDFFLRVRREDLSLLYANLSRDTQQFLLRLVKDGQVL